MPEFIAERFRNYYTYTGQLCWILLGLFSSSCQPEKQKGLTIAVSANMQFAATELLEDFTKSTGTTCKMVKGSSGKLTTQIKEGAPFHVFLSADIQYPQQLFAKGLSENPPKIYAYGHLVLWTAKKEQAAEITALSQPELKHIALANPNIAPYGKAAQEVLTQLNLLDSIGHKLVFGESISQVNQFVASKSADMGFTSLSSVKATKMQEIGNWVEIDNALYSPISQAGVAIKVDDSSSSTQKALDFMQYLSSRRAQEILQKHGYSLP